MDISKLTLENRCLDMKSNLEEYFDWNNMDVNYSMIDLGNQKVYTIGTDPQWQRIYDDNKLNDYLFEQLEPGLQFWHNYSEPLQNSFNKLNKNKMKVDLCNKYCDIYEIYSINIANNVDLEYVTDHYIYRSIVADYAHEVWNANPEMGISLEKELIVVDECLNESINQIAATPDKEDFMRFLNFSFTYKEHLSIRLLQSNRTVKQISVIQGCSEIEEENRIQKIKDKMFCPNASIQELRNVLKENHISLIAIDTLFRPYYYYS